MKGLPRARKLVPAIAALLMTVAAGQAQEWQTTSSLMGESKYGQNFKRYDYVNPDAPKGGTLNSTALGTFDSFNPYIVRGTPAAGLVGFGGGLLYDTLMEQAIDEPSVSHPLIAEAYKYPPDYSSATYRLDPRARWHDGKPITAEDVVWSLNKLKVISPQYGRYYDNVTEAVALNEREVEFRFDQKGNRELPKIIGDLVVLPKHWWEGTDASGRKRDITQPTLEPPLGSAAYKIASFKPGSEIVWERVKDYWGQKLPVKIGRENFDRRRYVYFQDDNAMWQAFTKGGLEDIQAENSSRRWATFYNFPAFEAGDVLKKEFRATGRAFMQGFVLNLRRPQFQDRRVRQALTYAFDFETMNRTIFFGFNRRTSSYFVGSELASTGLPQGKELDILNQYKDQLPPEVFTEKYILPVYEQPRPAAGDPPLPEPASPPKPERTHLREIVRLFAEAGWKIRDGRMTNEKTGAPFAFEILGNNATDEVIATPYINMLRKIGINATLRIVDASQYIERVNNFDFDMITSTLPQSDSPGNEQRDFWSSKAADIPGSRNLMGIKNPVVDALVERVIFATDREDLVAATNALDRVLLWNFYVIPQYHRPVVWLAYWNKFGIPEKQPDYLGPDIESWWIDPEKEKALAAKYKGVKLMRASRRRFLGGAGAALAAPLLPAKLFAESPTGTPLHGLSAFGDLKYGPDFTHFDYVNPDAPKGGLFSFSPPNWLFNQNPQTFNTLNSFVARGDAPPRMELCFDSLMTNKTTTALDEPDAVYGLLAESVTISEDRRSFEFVLRPEARFHDGSPLTAEDAAFTYELFKKDGHPSLLLVLTEMTEAVALDRHRLKLTFSGKHSERTILDAVTFPILSKAYYTEHSFEGSDLKPPLGSGPYKVGRVSPGQTIEYERMADYWGKDLPVNRGAYNFDRIRIDFYRNRQAGFEAFKKGDVLYRQEFTARVWATEYTFPAIAEKKVIKRDFPSEKRPSMQAVAINLRRERFQDVRVRRAIGMCFDFEWTKRNLFYDSYERSQSSFERSDYKAEGTPSPEELALLEPLREQLPPEVFGEAVMQPVSNASGRDRKLLSAASKLLAEAGWTRNGGGLENAKGERLSVEFLDDDDTILRVFSPWVENMRAIGIDASMRVVDAAQMQARQADFDFDLVMMALSWDATPTEDGLSTAFHSRSAKLPASRNLPGTADPAVDALIAAVGRAADRQSHVVAMRALDRVLRARQDWIPCWYSANHRAAFWDMFGFTEPKPDYGFPVEALWWYDKDKAAAIGKE